MDRLCFPQEMWMSGNEMEMLIEANAEATILSYNGCEIGQAITLPENSVASILSEVDAEFYASQSGLYSYSESILPLYQRRGYGGFLLHEISLRMRRQGFTSISAHVRTRHGWHIKRTKTLNVTESRLLHEFWEDPCEVVQYQRAQI